MGFDANRVVSGCNDFGTFELPASAVTVVVSDAMDDFAAADAVRWELVLPESSDR